MTEFGDVFCSRCPCGHPIVLPRQGPLGIYEGLHYRPTEGVWPVRFLCINCGQVTPALTGIFERIHPSKLPAQNLPRNLSLWKIDCECAHSNCGSQRTIYATWFPRGLESELAAKVAEFFVGVWCDSQHEFYPNREKMKLEKLEF